MVVVAVSSGLLVALVGLIVGHVRSSTRMEAMLRLQSNWNRAEFFLVQEIQEAKSASVSGDTLTLTLPDDREIVFSVSDNTLTRNGPPVDADGVLTSASNRTDVLIRGVTEFAPTFQNQTVNFRLDLNDPTGVTYANQSSGAQLRIRSVIPAS